MKIHFIGAAGTVTGSKYLVTTAHSRVLVDCGLFQGLKQLRLRNWAPLPIEPGELSAVVLTHAHLDHSGYLPLLVKNGFRGRIYCTAATLELCRLLLPDSGRLQEEDAGYANRHGFSRHHPALPLYTGDDAKHCLRYLHPIGYDREFEIGSDLHAHLEPAGHILGAAFVVMTGGRRTLTFSGDLGRPHDPVMKPPRAREQTDYLVVESTYGNKVHPAADPAEELAAAVTRTIGRGGVVVVPSFAVGRAQSLLYQIHRLKADGRIPASLPVYLNSPMAADVTSLYERFPGEHRLSRDECRVMSRTVTFVNTVEESKHLNSLHQPMIIVAASGMATGGRVIHHLRAFAPDPRNLILFSGYQAAGTRGAAMLGGATDIRIHGQDVPVRAEIAALSTLSAHADSAEILQWLGNFRSPPRQTFITHGEPVPADALRQRIERKLGWAAMVPDHGQIADLAD
ncbi:MAG TPA: MBL fold metallo-hydrolase [Rhodanobacteraceae bacterium]|jgi:metallo-beta-lactamase family protein|nr:MBL fold metallo-hydrolase [Rhodanobacteraceae bacterium]